jgi:tetratricopeptide (TPR) repeat protein
MKRKHEKLMVLGVMSIMGLATVVVDADMVGLWEFDFGLANDSCGGHHGILVGNPSWETGRVGGALLFDGDDCVRLPKEADFDFTDAMTVACWIKVKTSNNGRQPIVSKGTWRLVRARNTNTLAFECPSVASNNDGGGNNRGVRGDVNVNEGQWHHVVGVYDGLKMYLYVDGTLDESLEASGAIVGNVHNVCIGRNPKRKNRPRNFNGLIDDVAVFDHALSENEVTKLYRLGGASFIPKGYMAKLVEEANTTVEKLEPQEAVAFLENRIAEYRQWKMMNPNNVGPRDKQLSSDVYFLLAKVKEAAGLPMQDVVAAYKQSVSQVLYRTNYVPAALLWLFESVPATDYVNVVGQFVRNTNVPSYNIYYIAKHFESNENWDAFKLFLDGTFSTVEFRKRRAYLYARVIGKSLEEDRVWATKFGDYCRNKPELTTYLFRKHEEMARKYIAQQNFRKAAEIYRDIVGQCGPNQEKTIYEFNVCECLFNSGQYDSTIREIDNFIKDNKATNKALVRRAIMLRGQAYVHLGDIDRATDTFFTLMVEYPKAAQGPDANFFIGYCYMLQGKFDEAAEAFDLVVKDYPESSYIDKARSYLTRIKSMAH